MSKLVDLFNNTNVYTRLNSVPAGQGKVAGQTYAGGTSFNTRTISGSAQQMKSGSVVNFFDQSRTIQDGFTTGEADNATAIFKKTATTNNTRYTTFAGANADTAAFQTYDRYIKSSVINGGTQKYYLPPINATTGASAAATNTFITAESFSNSSGVKLARNAAPGIGG